MLKRTLKFMYRVIIRIDGKTVGDWTQKYLYAENIANDINYLKIEMQKLDIDGNGFNYASQKNSFNCKWQS